MGNAMHEVGGAVQRVNDPAMGFVRTFNLAAFFHQKAVSGPRGLQLFADNAFGFQIGICHEITGAFLRYLQFFNFTEITAQGTAGFFGGRAHDVQTG